MADEPIKLNLGAGETVIEGFTPIDIRNGQQAYPLPDYEAGSVDEVRASHLLEHFPYTDTMAVVREWYRVLKPGGWLKVAVPDFQKLAKDYLAGEYHTHLEAVLLGGNENPHDIHRALFDEPKLQLAFEEAGFMELQPWESEIDDAANMESSLNLMGRKPLPDERPYDGLRVAAVMSIPRLGFNDTIDCIFKALLPLRIPINRVTGAFWGQCLTRAMMLQLRENRPDAILTIDYDTLFKREDVETLVRLMIENPEADAIATLQPARWRNLPILTVKDESGRNRNKVERSTFDGELTKIDTAHFGLTLIRVAALRDVPHPWFCGIPNPENGLWDDARLDEDIFFWRRWAECGKTLFLANRVPVGHLELMAMWPDGNLDTIYQLPKDFVRNGKPEGVWI